MSSIPGVTVDRMNIAGYESGQQANFVAKGADPEDTMWAIDGVVITDMAAIGSSPDYFDFDSFEEIASRPRARRRGATGGLGINLAAKRGTNEFHGSFNGYFTHDDLQWSNIPDELVGRPAPPGQRQGRPHPADLRLERRPRRPHPQGQALVLRQLRREDIRLRRSTIEDKTRLPPTPPS